MTESDFKKNKYYALLLNFLDGKGLHVERKGGNYYKMISDDDIIYLEVGNDERIWIYTREGLIEYIKSYDWYVYNDIMTADASIYFDINATFHGFTNDQMRGCNKCKLYDRKRILDFLLEEL